jgi:hypothetical protein
MSNGDPVEFTRRTNRGLHRVGNEVQLTDASGEPITPANPLPVTPFSSSSAGETFTIPSGADGSAVTPVDLGQNYRLLGIYCADADGIPSGATLAAEVGLTAADSMADLYEQDDPSTVWGPSVPDTGTFFFILTHAFGARRIRLVLSGNATADVTFTIYGFDAV